MKTQKPEHKTPQTQAQVEFTRRAFLFSLANVAGLAALGFNAAYAAETPASGTANGMGAAAGAKAAGAVTPSVPLVGLSFAPAKPFSYKTLIAKAEEMAK
ncbi:MAG: hypothetical protein ACP5Q0_08630, partial [Halothiobacillus sp.]